MQFLDKTFGADVYPGTDADLLQEGHQATVLAGVIIGEHLADIARVGEPLALRHAQKEARQPVGEIAADEQQVIVLELMKQLFGRQVFALQRADELKQVLVRYYISWRGGELAEQVVDDRALQLVALGGEIGNAVRGIGQHFGRRRAAESLQIYGGLEQRIECGRDEQVEIRDRGEAPQRL